MVIFWNCDTSCRDNEELILDHNGRDDTIADGAIYRNIRCILMRRDAELSIHNQTVLGTISARESVSRTEFLRMRD